MAALRRGNLTVAIVTAIAFLATGLYVTHWGTVPTVVGALCLLVVVFGVAEFLSRRWPGGSSSRQ